ncbi:hypothetical protein BDV12DRAFT_207828 [Aspergillus spectabilis]
MKSGYRIALCLSLLFILPLYFLEAHLADLSDQYRAGSYLLDWLTSNNSQQNSWPAYNDDTKDKVIVMARLEEEPVHWVKEELPDWQTAVYTVNPSKSTVANKHRLQTPLNKGHEAMAYLTYLIDHYRRLPSTIAFIHAHRAGFLMAWHVDAPMHDNAAALRSLQLDFVQRTGYVNLRCNRNPGCTDLESHKGNQHVTKQIFTEVFEGTSTPLLNSSTSPSPIPTKHSHEGEEPLQRHTQKTIKPLQFPPQISAACCAQFAVSRAQVLQRPRADYIKVRQWVIDTELSDAASGRVMEYLWHVIFGREGVFCPDEELCYCQVYGQC